MSDYEDFLAKEDIERFVRFAEMVDAMSYAYADFTIVEMV
jgi:hypothetical protein